MEANLPRCVLVTLAGQNNFAHLETREAVYQSPCHVVKPLRTTGFWVTSEQDLAQFLGYILLALFQAWWKYRAGQSSIRNSLMIRCFCIL